MNCDNDEVVVTAGTVFVFPSGLKGSQNTSNNEESVDIILRDFDKAIIVYPNPSASGEFMIWSNLPVEDNSVSIELFNYAGNTIWSNEKYTLNSDKISLAGQAKGIYLMKISYQDKVTTKKLIFE